MNYKFINKSQAQLTKILADLNREIQKETHPKLIEIQQSLQNSIEVMKTVRTEQKLNIDVMKEMVAQHADELIRLFPDMHQNSMIACCLETKFTVYVRTHTELQYPNLITEYRNDDFYENFYSSCFKQTGLPFGSVSVRLRHNSVQVEIKLPKKVDTVDFMDKLRELSQNIDSFIEIVNELAPDAINFINKVGPVHQRLSHGAWNYNHNPNAMNIPGLEKIKEGKWQWTIDGEVFPVKLQDNRIVFYHPTNKEIYQGYSHYYFNEILANYK